jgi:hypothetical protein
MKRSGAVPNSTKKQRTDDASFTDSPSTSDHSFSGPVGEKAVDALYKELPGDEPSVFMRFPGVEMGEPMLEQINKVYLRSKPLNVAWYNEEGTPQLCCHELNHRRQAAVINGYVSSIRAYGISQAVRGAACAVPSKGGGPPYRLLTFGSLSRAAYACMTQYRGEKKIEEMRLKGLTILVYDERLPSDAARYIRDYFNRFHGGSSTSFLEVLTATTARNAEWKSYALRCGIPLSRNVAKTNKELLVYRLDISSIA